MPARMCEFGWLYVRACVCMHVCMCACIVRGCMYGRAFVYACARVCVPVRKRICMSGYVYECVCIRACMCAHACMYLCMSVCMHVYKCMVV